MYATVKLLNGYARPLTYHVPPCFLEEVRVGMLVRVPLQKRVERGMICALDYEKPTGSFTIRDMLEVERVFFDEAYHHFIQKLSSYYGIDAALLYRRIAQPDEMQVQEINGVHGIHNGSVTQLTQEQQNAVDGIVATVKKSEYAPAVLYGVTGSGKTEVYIRLIQAAYEQRRTTMLLLPEVLLAATFTNLLQQRLQKNTIPVYDYHSATKPSVKKEVWQALVEQKPIVLVGVHVPILLPCQNLGLIIIDEEHDAGFQEKRHPRINTKEAALLRARSYNIPIVLGSATPSLASLQQVDRQEWSLYRLTERFSGSFPRITIASLAHRTKRFQDREQIWITDQLHDAIQQRLVRREQTIIFLNRRGLNKFVQCQACSYIFSCHACSVSLTLHTGNQLVCHYCAGEQQLPLSCPSCNVSDEKFIKRGVGTQRLVELLAKRFPQARIARADTDTVREKRAWHTTLERMQQGEIDILVGTQTVTKGYHFPKVTLVGIIWAESNLTLPFYNAAETTLQQILQVAGRAGRVTRESDVIVQSFIQHPIFSYLSEREYMNFYEYEIAHRHNLGYPPIVRMSEILLQHKDEHLLQQESERYVHLMRHVARKNGWEVKILGPSLPPVHRIQHQNMRKIYLKSVKISWHLALFRAIQRECAIKNLWFHPNPLQ